MRVNWLGLANRLRGGTMLDVAMIALTLLVFGLVVVLAKYFSRL
jgi:hypothetical protein